MNIDSETEGRPDVPYLGIAISEGIGVCKFVGAILEIVPSPIIGEAIAFPVGSFNDNGFSVKAPADGNNLTILGIVACDHAHLWPVITHIFDFWLSLRTGACRLACSSSSSSSRRRCSRRRSSIICSGSGSISTIL